MAIISYNSHLGLAEETAWGTAATAPTFWVPYKTLKSVDTVKRVVDKGIRGNLTEDYASYESTRSATEDIEGEVYPDTVGYFLLGIFGQDNVTGSSAPYSHKFTLSNNQPPSFSLFDYDGINERLYTGATIEELDFKFTTEGEVTQSVKMMSKASSLSGSTHTPSYSLPSAAPIFVGYQAALQIAGAANTRLTGGNVNFKRTTKFTFGANNSQDPTKVNSGVLSATGKFDFEVDDYTELNYYLNNTQPSVTITFVNGSNQIVLSLGKCDFEKVDGLDRSQEMVRVSATIRGLYNTTDNGPASVTLTNSVASYTS